MKNIKKILYSICLLSCPLLAKITFTDISSTLDIKTTGSYTFSNPGVRHINGTISAVSPQNILGTKFFYENGIYTNGDFEINVTGTYDVTNSYSFLLIGPDAHFNCFNYGIMDERLTISGIGCRIEGYPAFRNPNSINIKNRYSSATFSLQRNLNTNIVLNSGDIQLDSNLSLADDIKITGSGTIHFNAHNVQLGTNDLLWTDTQTMFNAQNLVLGAKSTLRGQWIFKNDAHIVGNDFILDLTNGGSLFIKSNTTVLLSELRLKGLGSGFIIFESPTSKLELVDVVIDMDKSVTLTQGNVYISEDSIILTRDKLLTFDKTSSLSVNACTLYYDPMSYSAQNNIRFTDINSNYASLNQGSIKSVSSVATGDYIITANTTLDQNIMISPLNRLLIQDSAVVNGDGFVCQFSLNPGEDIFFLTAGKRAQFENILMLDMPTDYISLGTDSQLIFGPQATIALGASGTLTDTWYISGNAVLDGNDNILNFGANGHIVLRPGAQLWLNNITLRNIRGNDTWGSIVCMDNTCTISFGNVTWAQSANYSFTQGNFYVVGLCTMQGTSKFNYATNKQSTIKSFGTLHVDKKFTFHYMPPTNNRDLIAMDSAQSFLTIHGGATLSSTTTGLRLTNGTLVVPAVGYLNNSGAVSQSQGICFGNGNSANNLTISIEGTLKLLAGRLVNKNV